MSYIKHVGDSHSSVWGAQWFQAINGLQPPTTSSHHALCESIQSVMVHPMHCTADNRVSHAALQVSHSGCGAYDVGAPTACGVGSMRKEVGKQ